MAGYCPQHRESAIRPRRRGIFLIAFDTAPSFALESKVQGGICTSFAQVRGLLTGYASSTKAFLCCPASPARSATSSVNANTLPRTKGVCDIRAECGLLRAASGALGRIQALVLSRKRLEPRIKGALGLQHEEWMACRGRDHQSKKAAREFGRHFCGTCAEGHMSRDLRKRPG